MYTYLCNKLLSFSRNSVFLFILVYLFIYFFLLFLLYTHDHLINSHVNFILIRMFINLIFKEIPNSWRGEKTNTQRYIFFFFYIHSWYIKHGVNNWIIIWIERKKEIIHLFKGSKIAYAASSPDYILINYTYEQINIYILHIYIHKLPIYPRIAK